MMNKSIIRNSIISLIFTLAVLAVWCGCSQSSHPVRLSESLIEIAPLVNKLARDDTVFGQWFPSGTILYLTGDGKAVKFCLFSRNTMFQGHYLNGSGSNGWTTTLYPSGKLANAGLARMEVIGGIPCATGTFLNEIIGFGSSVPGGRTFFYENGRLQYAKAARTTEYKGRIIKKGQHVRLKEDGTIDDIK